MTTMLLMMSNVKQHATRTRDCTINALKTKTTRSSSMCKNIWNVLRLISHKMTTPTTAEGLMRRKRLLSISLDLTAPNREVEYTLVCSPMTVAVCLLTITVEETLIKAIPTESRFLTLVSLLSDLTACHVWNPRTFRTTVTHRMKIKFARYAAISTWRLASANRTCLRTESTLILMKAHVPTLREFKSSALTDWSTMFHRQVVEE
mmetsp:Transcript_52671/g.78074  ORF Transcript_52671/g.78074 Transcript_52671/m.78074 type:complete len:205 (+) Transcript_52671:478-1092(+)